MKRAGPLIGLARLAAAVVRRSPASSLIAAAVAVSTVGLALSPASAASGSVSSGAARRALPTACLRSYDPYAVTKAFLESCHDGIYPLQRVIKLSGGGREYVYDVAGIRTVSRTPPPGFNPLTASNARLVEYGYPPGPSGSQAIRQWAALVRDTNFGAPASYLVSEPNTTPPPDILPASAQNNIWAGNMAVGHTYKDVYADWLEPTIHSSACSPTAESTWVGLGGYHVETLAQAGTAVGEGSAGVGAHQAWYELIHQKINKFMPIPVHATVGGEFTAEVDRTAHGYYIFVKNDFTGKAKDYTPSFRYYVGATAEAIVEDPFGGEPDGGPFLANFKSLKIEDAQASENGTLYHGLGHFEHDDLVMISADHGGRRMAYPGKTFNSGDSWYDYEQHCS
ncbi:MAG: G1 family glutamic endopeptidase [Streptosporangiaceae bacterium]